MQFTGSLQRESAITNSRIASDLAKFREANETCWFDGTPQSVDRRLAACNALLTRAQAAIARSPFDPQPHEIVAELDVDRRALIGVREDLLNGGAGRVAPVERTAGRAAPRLDRDEARWVALEAPKFVRANLDCVYGASGDPTLHVASGLDEMAIRAQNHVRRALSASINLPALVEAFVTAVIRTARQLPPPPEVKTASRDDFGDLPDEAMWL